MKSWPRSQKGANVKIPRQYAVTIVIMTLTKMWPILALLTIFGVNRARADNDHKGSKISRSLVRHELVAAMLHARWADALCRCRERHTEPVLEKQRLEPLRHVGMHHWTVAESLDISLKYLKAVCPTNIKNLLTRNTPTLEMLKLLHSMRSFFVCHHVEKGVTYWRLSNQVNRHVHKIIAIREALCIQHATHHLPGEAIRQVPEHHCCAPVL